MDTDHGDDYITLDIIMSNDYTSYSKDLETNKTPQNSLQRDVDQAAKIGMAHKEIQRLKDEVEVKEKEQNKSDSVDLQKAKEHNQRLNEEILALRNRVRSLDSEKKMLGEEVKRLKGEIPESQENEQVGNHSLGKSVGAEETVQLSSTDYIDCMQIDFMQ
ncbi:PREDICTED: moesin/ezrin/radixin homolog 1-like [Chrysochloris asiatica]|uniref:Moesin/ezrin/radixin homolog 1-like n=1 Tax=Chrysochloris asiatica TaxID=185453 RepID=A0A9B0TAB5_CHRAS|nr:PREDICTED: moesin/ezrin/radixin homolog 1-like [Chrysochloris asiatica]